MTTEVARRPAHNPVRPLWLCRSCAAPWPCGPGRLALLQRYHGDRIGLALHLADAYRDALHDLTRLNPYGGPGPADLYRRFLGWPRT